MQIPGPTLIVHQNDTVTVTLTNNLPAAAGNTSILFPGFQVTTQGGVQGLLTQEAAHGGTVTYTFVATTPGTHSYYSGTQVDLQIEMGMYGAIIVLPTFSTAQPMPTGCRAVAATLPDGQTDFRNAPAAYNLSAACYDRDYLFQFSEMDPRIHSQAEQQAAANASCARPSGCMTVETEPYHPAYYMVNGRSMPDDMDPNYSPQYPHQPYNGIRTCTPVNWCYCVSSARAAGSIRSMSTAITCASWRATAIFWSASRTRPNPTDRCCSPRPRRL
jgi:FtsP/CotA-like multicopper oxidase with cupredoxin domain